LSDFRYQIFGCGGNALQISSEAITMDNVYFKLSQHQAIPLQQPTYFLPLGNNWKLTTPRGEDLTPKIASRDLLVVAHITFRGVVCQPISQSQKATEL